MDRFQKNHREYYTIDMAHVMRTIRYRLWIIFLAGVLVACVGFAMSAFLIEPQYSSSIRLYVNNSSSSDNSNFSSSQIDAAQKLVNTYREILHSDPTYNKILEKTELEYDSEQLSRMIVSGSSNETEVMYVTVTTNDPYEAAQIANCIAEVLPVRISQVIDGASVEIVEGAKPKLDKISPSITKYTVIGLVLGALVALFIVVIYALADNTVHDENYMMQTYEYPMLAKIPDLLEETHSKRYGYYKSHSATKSHWGEMV